VNLPPPIRFYTKFEQGFIIDMFERGLLYRKKGSLNWCPHDQTVLANEQVIEGRCWRCDTEVVQRDMYQYYLRISDYAQELLDDLQSLEGSVAQTGAHHAGELDRALQAVWPLACTLMKRHAKNWASAFEGFEVFTTRPDTIYGVTYAALAPEHEIVSRLIESKALDEQTLRRLTAMKNTGAVDRQKHKQGVALGLHVTHPLTGKSIPVWVANFVLMGYGSGAVMAVPAHDERDFAFAAQYGLGAIKSVICPAQRERLLADNAYTEAGCAL
jgi:leucyl-tRNA synthetase